MKPPLEKGISQSVISISASSHADENDRNVTRNVFGGRPVAPFRFFPLFLGFGFIQLGEGVKSLPRRVHGMRLISIGGT